VYYQAYIPTKFDQPAIYIYVSNDLFQMTSAFNPKFVFMTGVCAGDHFAKVAYGDLLIATESFQQSGNNSSNSDDDKFITWVKGIMYPNQKWKQHPIIDFTKPSKALQKQFILRSVFELESGKVSDWLKNYNINVDDLLPDSLSKMTQFPPCWNELILELSDKGRILRTDTKWRLSESETRIMKRNMATHGCNFPNTQITGPENPTVHFGKFGTWSKPDETDDGTINAFTELRKFRNDIIGLDMDSAFVYSFCEKSKVKSLVMKGVIDFAESRRNDIYDQFGYQLSAGYALELIKLLYKYSS